METGDGEAVTNLDYLNKKLANGWRVLSVTPMGVAGGVAGAAKDGRTDCSGEAVFQKRFMIASLVVIERLGEQSSLPDSSGESPVDHVGAS